MPDIEKIIQKATIKFPEAIDTEQAKQLLVHLAKTGGYSFGISVEQSMGIGKRDETPAVIEKGTAAIKGMATNGDGGFSAFSLQRETSDDITQFSYWQFSITPGWGFSDYQPEELELWDDIRKRVNDFYTS